MIGGYKKVVETKKEKLKGFLPSNLYIYFFCLNTRYATASKPAIANTASKPCFSIDAGELKK
jgi:hypothetical protein